jgi:DNA recombination protein RmuC
MANEVVIILLVLLVSGVVALWSAFTARRESAALRQEMQALLAAQAQVAAAQAQAMTTQLGQLGQTVTSQLGQVSQQVQGGMASAGTLASGAQKAVSEELQKSTEMLGTIRQQLGQMQQAGKDLSEAARKVENVLGATKTRGTLGEVALERLLADALPPASFQMQYRFSTGEAVDAVVHLRDKLLPIDSKFPLEDYRRLVEVGEEARGKFCSSARFHADCIAKKYLLPEEGTLDMALMFVPSEGVYYEMLRTSDAKGMSLQEYCRKIKVTPVSPATLYSHLQIILLGLRGMQIEETAARLLSSLSGLQKQMLNFNDVYEKLGTHLRNAQQSYQDGDRKLERARDSLNELANGAPAEKALEVATRE